MDSAAREALEKLENCGKAATSRPWRAVPEELACIECDALVGCLQTVAAEQASDVCFVYAKPKENAALIVVAVNLSESLAAVARAAFEVDAAYGECGTVDGDRIRAAHAMMDDALKQFRRQARTLGFGLPPNRTGTREESQALADFDHDRRASLEGGS